MPRRHPRHRSVRAALFALCALMGASGVAVAEAEKAPEAQAPPTPAAESEKPAEAEKPAAAEKPAEVEAAPAAEAPAEPEPEPEPRAPKSVDQEGGGDEAAQARKTKPKKVHVEGPAGGTIYWITIDETIELGLAPYVERVVGEANDDPKAVAIVSEIHTPGGRVDAAVRIRDALLGSDLPTIAFIHSEAISAGALIALAHDYIALVPGGTIGAATPIQLGAEGGAQPVGEKVTSYVRGVFRATAEAKDRDPVVAEAMVDAAVHIPGLAPKGKLLTATAKQALEWGIGDVLVEDQKKLLETTGLEGPRIERRDTNWAEAIARVLTDPMISGMLMSFGFLGLLMEFYSPGFGVIGGIGITLLLLFFFGHYVVHLAGLEELALFGLGIVLLLAEVFFIPGFGIAGIAGVGAIVVALVLSLIANPIDVSIDTGELGDALLRVLISLGATALIGVLVVARFARSATKGRSHPLVLADAVTGRAVGFGADAAGGTDGDLLEAPAVGTRGVAKTALRPSGKVRVEGRVFDALSSGPMIEAGAEVEVKGTRNANLLVKAVPADAVEDVDGE